MYKTLFYKKKNVEERVLNYKSIFLRSKDVLFIGCDIQSEVIVVWLHLKHVSLGLNIYH